MSGLTSVESIDAITLRMAVIVASFPKGKFILNASFGFGDRCHFQGISIPCDASFFGLNPLAFWKRAEAAAHGFESVRGTIEQNFAELSEVFADWGLALDRRAAARRAARARQQHGWTSRAARETSSENAASRRLHVLGARREGGTAA